MSTNPNDPAFCPNYLGTSKREYFAALMMQGMVSDPETGGHMPASKMADGAVHYADALIEALNKAQS